MYKPSLPAVIMGNVRSLGNKMDRLSMLIKTQRKYHECTLCFAETWLHSDFPRQQCGVTWPHYFKGGQGRYTEQ